MTADLATIATGTANPGSFYGRNGQGPRAALSAAVAAERATTALRNALKGAPDTPLPACLNPIEHIRRAGWTLTGCLTLEASIAAGTLTPDLSIPCPAAARQARADLQRAASHAGQASRGAGDAWRALRKLTRESRADSTITGTLSKAAAGAETAAADLGTQLRRASRQTIPPTLPMITGHAQITNYLSLALIDLSTSYAALAAIVRYAAPRAARAENQVTGPLQDAAGGFRLSCNAAMRACHVLTDGAEIIRKSPPGFPCASCGGTTLSRLTKSACGSCRGSGIDVRAMRTVADY
jgi:hypothetical protein